MILSKRKNPVILCSKIKNKKKAAPEKNCFTFGKKGD
jgi:hypothetical protein